LAQHPRTTSETVPPNRVIIGRTSSPLALLRPFILVFRAGFIGLSETVHQVGRTLPVQRERRPLGPEVSRQLPFLVAAIKRRAHGNPSAVEDAELKSTLERAAAIASRNWRNVGARIGTSTTIGSTPRMFKLLAMVILSTYSAAR